MEHVTFLSRIAELRGSAPDHHPSDVVNDREKPQQVMVKGRVMVRVRVRVAFRLRGSLRVRILALKYHGQILCLAKAKPVVLERINHLALFNPVIRGNTGQGFDTPFRQERRDTAYVLRLRRLAHGKLAHEIVFNFRGQKLSLSFESIEFVDEG